MAAMYSFVSRWHVPAPAERVWEELERMLRPGAPLWWPALAVPMPLRRVVAGERLVLAVRSPLGYTLRVLVELTDVEPGRAIGATSSGDLRGSGRVEVEPAGAEAGSTGAVATAPAEGGGTVVTFHWDVETRRAWMNATAWLFRPAFERAHAHVMRRGELGLRAALAQA